MLFKTVGSIGCEIGTIRHIIYDCRSRKIVKNTHSHWAYDVNFDSDIYHWVMDYRDAMDVIAPFEKLQVYNRKIGGKYEKQRRSIPRTKRLPHGFLLFFFAYLGGVEGGWLG